MPLDYQQFGTGPSSTNSDGSFNWSSLISPTIGAAGSVIGAGQLKNGISAANAQQQQVYNQVAGIYQPQYQAGVGADQSLAAALGLNGAAPNYAAFQNSPGYQFALQQGDQAIQRAAAAQGNSYNSSTLAALDKYNVGLASQNYQNYVQNLLQTAGLGNQAAGGMASARYNTGANIGQGLNNIGAANSSGVQGALQAFANPLGNFASSLFRGGGGGGGGGYGAAPGYGGAYGGTSGTWGDPSQYAGTTDANGTPYFLSGDTSVPQVADNTQWFDPGTGFNSAGGEAAAQNASGVAVANNDAQSTNNSALAGYNETNTDSGSQNSPGVLGELGTGAAAAGNALAIYNGLQRGGVTGYGGAALNAANLANNVSKLSTGSPLIGGAAGGALGAAGGALGLYTGLKQGGVAGYTGAALGAANTLAGIGTLAGGAAAGGVGSLATLGSFAGPLGIALAPILMGVASAPYTLNGDYYNRMKGYLAAGPGPYASTGGFNGLYWDPQYTNYQNALQALGMQPTTQSGGGGGAKGGANAMYK